jgi:hypothetical protein
MGEKSPEELTKDKGEKMETEKVEGKSSVVEPKTFLSLSAPAPTPAPRSRKSELWRRIQLQP